LTAALSASPLTPAAGETEDVVRGPELVPAGAEDLSGVEEVEPTHEELLGDELPEVEPTHEELLGDDMAGEAVPAAAPAVVALPEVPAQPAQPRVVKDLDRARRRVRQSLRAAETMEAIREACDRGLVVGVPPAALAGEVAKVGAERVANAKGKQAKQVAEQWGRLARAACAQAVAAAKPPEPAQVVPPAGAAPVVPAAGSPVPGSPPAPPVKVLYRGQDPDKVEAAAESILWIVDSLAELTAGKSLDLMKARERVLFKGHPAERVVRGDPVTRFTELLAVRRAAAAPTTGVESPTWELGAYALAVGLAMLPEDPAAMVRKVKELWSQGSIGAARGVAGLVAKLQKRKPARPTK
jgi:hypothetical protein